MRKIFLNELPRYKDGSYKGKINWKESIGFKLNFIYDDIEGYLEIIDYIREGNTIKLKIKYNKKDYIIDIRSLSKCCLGNILNKYTSNFKINVGKNLLDKNIIITDRKIIEGKNRGHKKYYKYKCNKCGFDGGKHWSTKDKCYKDEYWIEECNLLQGKGCSCCGNKIVVEGINDIPTTAPWMIKYFQGGYEEAKKYTKNSNKKIIPICPCCGKNKNKKTSINNIYNYKGFSCPFCSDNFSYPNKFMFNLLKQLNIEFEKEYSPKWVKPKRYDFYIPSKNLIIEMDGGFHNKDNSMSGQTSKESKEIDNYKDKLAKEHGLKVIRIDCDYYDIESRFDYIKNNIINSKLNDIFDLNSIDWLKIRQDSEKNLVKEVCKYWYIHNNINNEEINTTDLIKIFSIERITIIKYLKIGNELGWCHYSPKEEKMKVIKKANESNEKQIEMFDKNGKLLGTFKSAVALSKLSLKLFGKQFNSNLIGMVCRGVRKSHQGYIFKYTE